MRFCRLAFVASLGVAAQLEQAQPGRAQSYMGMDRNEYPGDAAMQLLRTSFSYTGYWLNLPPEAKSNNWAGKRAELRGMGYGFLLLWNGRAQAGLSRDAAGLGKADGIAAAEAAERERFPSGAIVFLDQEEGGRLTTEQDAYVSAWVAALQATKYKPGAYASGIDVPDGPGKTISTARELKDRFPALALWVANDQCPPASGCRMVTQAPQQSGIAGTMVWQYAQSPRRPQFTAQCRPTYAPDGNCYAPGQPQSGVFLDLNTASSSDPSRGR